MNNFISLIGFLLPPAIDLINNKVADRDLRFWISVFVCVVVGTFVEWVLVGVLTWEGVATQSLLTFGMAQLTYNGIWEGSKSDRKLKTIQGT